MGPAIGESLVMAVGIAITPLAITAVIILLTTPQARSNGLAFLLGWLLGLAVVGFLVLLVVGSTKLSQAGEPKPWVSWMKIVLGLLLLGMAGYELSRPRTTGSRGAHPPWAERLERVRPSTALGLGAALAGLRPKNLILILAGTTAIAQTGISLRQQGIAFAVFVGIATLGIAIPVALYFLMGDRAPQVLSDFEDWLRLNSAPMIATLCLVIGLDLIGVGITALT